jgi:hypothetical protein
MRRPDRGYREDPEEEWKYPITFEKALAAMEIGQ